MDFIPDPIRGKNDPTTIQSVHPLLDDICAETYGIMVYQEQVMEAAKVIAGYSLGGADMPAEPWGRKSRGDGGATCHLHQRRQRAQQYR